MTYITKDKTKLFEETPVLKAILILSVPTIISQLITLIYNVADSYFIGKTGNPYMVAAVSLVFPLFALNNSFISLFGIGCGSLISRKLGLSEYKESSIITAFAVYGSIGIGVLYGLILLISCRPLLQLLGASSYTISYASVYLKIVCVLGAVPVIVTNVMANIIRNIGFPKYASIGLSSGACLNIILDPLFMFIILPDGKEIIGAALATLISNIMTLVFFIVLFLKLSNRTVLTLNYQTARTISKRDVKNVFSVGIPSAIFTGLVDITHIILNNQMAHHGDIPLAALGIVQKIDRLPAAIGIGLCFGMIPLVAYNYSKQSFDRMNKVINSVRIIGMIVIGIIILLYEIFAIDISQIFFDSNNALPTDALLMIATTSQFLRIKEVASLPNFFNYHSSLTLQALGDGRKALIHTVCRQLLFHIPLIFILNHFFGAIGLLGSTIGGEALGAVVGLFILKRKMSE